MKIVQAGSRVPVTSEIGRVLFFGELAEWFMAAVLLVRVPSQECEE